MLTNHTKGENTLQKEPHVANLIENDEGEFVKLMFY